MFVAALVLPIAAWSCAKGTTNSTVTELDPIEPEIDSGAFADAGASLEDAAISGRDASRPDARGDGGDEASSREAGSFDAGANDAQPTEAGAVRNDLCNGADSQQAKDPFGASLGYDALCDAYHRYNGGNGKACAASGDSCSSFTGGDGYQAYCCFLPPQGSSCASDYGGVPQCVPQ